MAKPVVGRAEASIPGVLVKKQEAMTSDKRVWADRLTVECLGRTFEITARRPRDASEPAPCDPSKLVVGQPHLFTCSFDEYKGSTQFILDSVVYPDGSSSAASVQRGAA